MIIGIVEDNEVVVEMLKTAFTLRGHEIYSYKTGFAFLHSFQIEQQPLDVLMLDLLLPGGLSGEETLQSFYQLSPTSTLPIIVITGAGDPTIQRVQQQFPLIPIVAKPPSLRKLIQLIEQTAPSR